MSRKFRFACLLILPGLLLTASQSGYAQSVNGPLNFGNNYFVTGDYIVSGAKGMNTNFSNGYAVGTFTIPDANPGIQGATSVPPGAEVVAALLYWQTVENVGTVPGQPGTGANGFFRPVIKNGGPAAPGYPISGVSLPGHNAVSWSSGGCSEPSTNKITRTYRANVIGALPRDSSGNIEANSTYEIRLPSVGPQTPLTLGASLVIIYRILSPNVPLRSIVIYDGAFGQDDVTLNMTQTVQGFYDADGAVSKLTLIAGAGKSNKSQTVYLNNVALPSPAGRNLPPFPGFYGTWDNPTWSFGDPAYPEIGNPRNLVPPGASFAKTEVVPSANGPGCLSWGVVIVSTTVQNSDNDGLLDSWKLPKRPGYCDASVNEGKCDPATDPSWVDLPGATSGEKDVFIQLDYMCSSPTGPDSCTTGDGTNYSFDPRLSGAIDLLAGVSGPFAKSGIQVHVNPLHTNQPDIHAIPETTCQDIPASGNTPAQLCSFPNQPGVVAWKGGFDFIKNQLIDADETNPTNIVNDCAISPPPAGEGCISRFQPGKRSSWHYILSAHAVGQPKWKLQDESLTTVKQSGHTVTFTTAAAVGMLDNINNIKGGPIVQDPSCANGRVTIFGAGTNANLNGTFCVNTSTAPNGDTFTIIVPGPSENASYTNLTDPNLAVAPSFTSTASGVSDVGGEDSLVTLGLWGKPAANGQTAQTSPASDGQSEPVLAGTFMHEFGHSLGLTHGGFTYQTQGSYVPTLEPNCKPNFQSVMNYQFQVDLLAPLGGGSNVPDYSGQVLASLSKQAGGSANVFSSLAPTYLNTIWFGPYNYVGTPITMHCDGSPNPNDTPASTSTGSTKTLSWITGQDINFDGNTTETLQGYNDWANVDLRQIGATGTNSTAEAGGQNFGGGGQNFGGGGQNLGGGGQNLGGGGQNFGGGGQNLGGGGQNFGGGGQNFGGGGEIDIATANAYTRPPQTLMASENGSARTITLNWTAPTFGQIGAYNVYRTGSGGILTRIPNAVMGTPPATMYTDTVPCNQTGYAYFITAVLSSASANPGQESTGSNTVTTGSNGPANGEGLLTGCYTVTGFSSPASAKQGSVINVTWSLQDDFNTTGAPVNNLAANTLVALGPGGTRTTLVSNGVVTAPGSSAFGVNSGTFTFNWDSDPFPSGSYSFELDLDSSQVKTTAPPLVLGIDVNDNDTPQITTVSVPNAVVGQAYSPYTIREDGGTAPLTWSSTALPTGILLDPMTGTLSGTTCVAAGSKAFTVMVTDSKSNSGMQAFTLQLLKADATTSVGPTANPSVYGQAVTFATTVRPQFTCTPTGTVIFTDSGVSLAGSSPVNPANLAGGTASYTTAAAQLVAGPHSITAVYNGDASFNFTNFDAGSTATALSQTVQKASPAFSGLSNQMITYGFNSVTVMGTLSANCSPSPGCSTVYPPSGEPVSVMIGAVSGAGTLGANGIFSVTVTGTGTLGVSTSPYAIQYSYNGDSNFNSASNMNTTLTVQKASPAFSNVTNQMIFYGNNSITVGGTLLAGCGVSCVDYAPNGEAVSVTIGSALGSGTIGMNGVFSVTVSGTGTLGVSSSPFTVLYGYVGDSNFNSASDMTTKLTVHKADTTTSVAASPGSSNLGDLVTVTATVTDTTANSSGTPTGLVTFFDNGTPIGTGTLAVGNSGNQATFTTSLLAVGSDSITAAYDGDANFIATGADANSTLSAAASETVALRGTNVSVLLNPSTQAVNSPSTMTVTVTDSGTTNPAGTADSWVATSAAPATGTTGSTATLFSDGMVLVAGGTNSGGTVVANAYIYSATTSTFTAAAGNLKTARTGAAATLLPNGEILIAGGSSDGTATNALQTAELFNPVTGTFTLAGSGSGNAMTAVRFGATATLLANGQVLIAGGQNSGGSQTSAELYNPATDTFTATGSLGTARYGGAAVLLGNGSVLIAGGTGAAGPLNSAELYTSGSFAPAGTGTMTASRTGATATLLLSGNVLIAGGSSDGTTALNSAELYNAGSATFTVSGSTLNTPRFNGSATMLPNGMALLVGGTTSQATELYDPDSDRFDATGSLNSADQASLTATLLNKDNVLITGLTSGGSPVADAELYTPTFDPLGTVALTSSDNSDVFSGPCVLTISGSGASTCATAPTVTPGEIGATNPHTITGTYPADSVHSTSTMGAPLTVQ
jgi:hypothetical protein